MALGAHRGKVEPSRCRPLHSAATRASEGARVAELVTIEGRQYKKREPLGVLGLSVITVGIYWLYWY
jgi:hypothetical protein